jgi:hypothetical protein
MGKRAITVGGALGALLACTLSLEGKTACRTSDDCVDGRVCVDGVCNDGACETLCAAICEGADDCGDPIADCEDRCLAGDTATPPLLPTLTASACGHAYDALSAGDSCDALECVLACGSLCELARECNLVVDEPACFAGCVERNEACAAAMPTTCVDEFPDDLLCWEDADACQ